MIVGRAPECARLEALLAGARAGRSGALVLEGEPGIGKTALLEHTAAYAKDFTVLHAVGVQSEARLAFSGLLQLLRPVLGELAAVPEPQAEALRRALGLTERASLDLYLAFAGALYLLAAASETRPVLCLVDDAHWLDAASAEGVGFVARRIEAERIAMLVAIRPGEGRAADLHGLECVAVGGLGADAARVLLGSAGVALAAGVADRLIEATGANPLALLEVPLVLSEGQRAGGESLEHPVAIGERVERAFLARAAGLSPAARRTLLVAAASEDGDLGVIAAVVGEAFAAIDEAEAAGLVRVRGTELAFRHPLVRSAIYTAASAGERRAAHTALAAALRDDPQDRDVWHLAEAAVGADEALAEALDAAAQRAAPRSVADEQRLYERAARLTRDPARRASRLLYAGRAADRGGRSDGAIRLLEDGLELAEDPLLRADLVDARLHAARAHGDVGAPIEMVLSEAARVEAVDPVRAADLAVHAWWLASERFDVQRARELLAHAHEQLSADDAETHMPMLAALAWQDILDAKAGSAAQRGASIELAAERMTGWARAFAECLMVLEEHALARRVLERAAAQWRARGNIVGLICALSTSSRLELRCGHVSQASVAAHEAVRLAEEKRLHHWHAISLAALAAVDAVLGDVAGRQHAHTAIEMAAPRQDRETEVYALDALGRLELGAGDAEAAVAALESVEAITSALAAPDHLLWAPDLIEAYVRCDRAPDARRVLAAFERRTARRPGAWATAAAARCRALLAPDADVDRAFAAALALCDPDRVSPFERARVELAWGERLRRGGHRRAARAQLQAAMLGFERLGAAGWTGRAREELRASGQTPRARNPALVNQLTPRELEVALLAGGGATNREIASRLFLSAKTIELHLGRVYRKLGIRSRTELARALPPDGWGEPLHERDPQ
ncbi:MAG TPA: AAA family ATPase [Candidatus Limnocylindria bacterium]|nr:AAA family ATPase [Candidatus Limnocylindria bacterium]